MFFVILFPLLYGVVDLRYVNLPMGNKIGLTTESWLLFMIDIRRGREKLEVSVEWVIRLKEELTHH